jgi:hypothetical protein
MASCRIVRATGNDLDRTGPSWPGRESRRGGLGVELSL